MTLVRLVSLAYDVPMDRVLEGPRWIDTDQYEVVAKSMEAASKTDLQTMLQALLADRFQLKVRREDRPSPYYALTKAKKGLQIKPAAAGSDGKCTSGGEPGVMTQNCHGMTIASLAERLRDMAPAYFDRPVVDRTGAEGSFDILLKWTGRPNLAMNPDGINLYEYMEKSLGIKVEAVEVPTPAIVVESANRTPTANGPGAEALTRPLPTEFEVVEVKAAKTDMRRTKYTTEHGRVEIIGFPLKFFITIAYTINGTVQGVESWMDSDLFDLVAKTDPRVAFDGMRPMIRKVLEDRFKLVTHTEDQTVPVYGLAVGSKLKLAEGDVNGRSSCKTENEGTGRKATCMNTTMAEFVDRLRGFAGGSIDRPMIDATELKGAYNFVVTWNPRAGNGGRGMRVADGGSMTHAAGADAANDPIAGLTIQEALEKQLGLKLVSQKHAMPVLVIDKANRTPTDN